MDKGQSPFYPGQPVPVQLFVGRQDQLDRIIKRGVGQVERGKPISIFVQGEYGIGKTSIARYVQVLAAENHGLLPVYVSLSPSQSPDDLAARIIEGAMHSGQIHPSRGDKIKTWLAKYIGKQELFGFSMNLEALRSDASKIASVHGLLDFLRQALEKSADANGVFLVLDEINGLANQPWFAQMIKSLVDTNALAAKPLPLLLMICGTEEKRRRMIENHQPVERIFDVIDIEPLSDDEMREFFQRAFELAGTRVLDGAMRTLTLYSAGFPKVMHLIGDWAYWTDQDLVIDEDDALTAVIEAAEDFGRKYVDQQVLAALRSQDYRSILSKITSDIRFLKQDVEQGLDDSERKKFNNFLQKMKSLNVLRSGSVKGEYLFNMGLVRLYLSMQRAKLARKADAT
jgi:DNA-binding MarR family transcriptional regulator